MTKHSDRYKKQHTEVHYPPFSLFTMFIQELLLGRNDPNQIIKAPEKGPSPNSRWPSKQIRVKKTSVGGTDGEAQPVLNLPNWRIVHRKPHLLNKCRVFQAKTFDEKTKS